MVMTLRSLEDAKEDTKEHAKEDAEGLIVVVALDIHFGESGFEEFKQLSALEKMEEFKQRIIREYDEVQKRTPGAWTIFSWEEFGLCDASERSIDDSTKKQFKKMLLDIAKDRPHIEIIAGPTQVRKTVGRDKLIKAEKFYEKHQWIAAIEEDDPSLEKEMKRHLAELKELIAGEATTFTQLKTVCYDVKGGEVLRHAKTGLYREYSSDAKTAPGAEEGVSHPKYMVPGKGRSLSPFFISEDNKRAPRTAVDICYENGVGVVAHHSEEKGIKPDLQFVLSNSINASAKNIAAPYLIHIDSFFPTQYVLSRHGSKLNRPIQVYRSNLLDSEAKLEGPIEPFVPLQDQMEDFITSLQKEWKDKGHDMKKLAPVSEIIDEFIKNCYVLYPDIFLLEKLIRQLSLATFNLSPQTEEEYELHAKMVSLTNLVNDFRVTHCKNLYSQDVPPLSLVIQPFTPLQEQMKDFITSLKEEWKREGSEIKQLDPLCKIIDKFNDDCDYFLIDASLIEQLIKDLNAVWYNAYKEKNVVLHSKLLNLITIVNDFRMIHCKSLYKEQNKEVDSLASLLASKTPQKSDLIKPDVLVLDPIESHGSQEQTQPPKQPERIPINFGSIETKGQQSITAPPPVYESERTDPTLGHGLFSSSEKDAKLSQHLADAVNASEIDISEIRRLLEAKADPHKPLADGSIPYEIAQSKKLDEVVKLFAGPSDILKRD